MSGPTDEGASSSKHRTGNTSHSVAVGSLSNTPSRPTTADREA
jgi:hypothetical protein